METLIRGARIVDGTGNPWFHGDLAIDGGCIAAIAPPGSIDADSVGELVDAAGLVVCPGFIDIQSHSILPLLRDGRSLSKVTQGVTTEIMGEAWTPAPFGGRIEHPFAGSFGAMDLAAWIERAHEWRRFGDWLEATARHGVSPNIGSFLGGGTLRRYAMGMAMGTAGDEALATMRRVAAEAMEDGAFGVAYALIYPPDSYAATGEIVEVCRAIAPHGGIYITHLRSESDGLLEALDEAIAIGRDAALPVEVYHLKASGRRNWGRMPAAIARIEAARASGLDVTADMYPYAASGTGLSAIIPGWVAADGAFYRNLSDPLLRTRIRDEMLRGGADDGLGTRSDPSAIMPVEFRLPEHRTYIGMRLSEIAALRGQDWADAACDLLATEGQRIGTIYFLMSEENVAGQLRLPWVTIATDAGGIDPAWAAAEGPTHPRAYGTYPRVLGRYVRDERVLTLEEAIRKMTSAVAARLGLRDRGALRVGAHADIVIFDPRTVADRATFEDPHRLSTGVRDVWINGVRVLANGVHTGATPGRVVRGSGALR